MAKVTYIYLSRGYGKLGWYRAWEKHPVMENDTWRGYRYTCPIDRWCPVTFHKFAFNVKPGTCQKVKITKLKKGFKWEKC